MAARKRRTVGKAATTTAGGAPVSDASGNAAQNTVTQQQAESADRLQQQRDAATERARRVTEQVTEGAVAMTGARSAEGVFTAVSRNGLFHRRNGIEFGGEPVTVDTSNWTEEQKQRFFNDTMLMIVSGVQLNARGATLAAAAAPPQHMTGGASEVATPRMLAAAANGVAMAHPSTGSANPVVGTSMPMASRQLEQIVNNKAKDARGMGEREPGDDGGEG